jgi:hypothetical protein
MKTLSRTEHFNATPEEIFPLLDDLGVTGTHMTKSSAMMMGTKLNLTYLTPYHTGLNSSYRWTGKMMGLDMDFTVRVMKWKNASEKVWETVGPTRLIIYSWYRMALHLKRTKEGTDAELSISYEKPVGFLNRILCFFLADWYCRWCLRKMLGDAKIMLEHGREMQMATH